MTLSNKNPDITVRGGLINVPTPTEPNRPPRHQPATPRTKKRTTVKPNHQVYAPEQIPTAEEVPPVVKETPEASPDEPSANSEG